MEWYHEGQHLASGIRNTFIFSDTGHTITFVLRIEKHSKFGDRLSFWFLLGH